MGPTRKVRQIPDLPVAVRHEIHLMYNNVLQMLIVLQALITPFLFSKLQGRFPILKRRLLLVHIFNTAVNRNVTGALKVNVFDISAE